jgi:PAS domain S-box-containing protein
MKPPTAHTRVLHLEDNDHDAELVRRTLEEGGIYVDMTRVMKRSTFVEALDQGAFDLILSDYSMPGFDGGSALDIARKKCPATPFVFVSGTIGEEAAIRSLKNGAANYVLKDRLDQLAAAIRTTLQESTEQQNAEQSLHALRQRADLFQQISQTVTDLVCVLDSHGRRLYTSPSYQSLFGAEPLHGTNAFDDIHPEDRERIRQMFQHTIKTGLGHQTEFRLLLKDRSIRYLQSHAAAIRDPEANAVILVSRDVTKRHCIEENLKASEECFRSVIQTANDAIVVADPNGNIITWNAAAQRMFAYAESEALGQPLTMLLAERYRDGRAAGLPLNPNSDRAGVSRFLALAVELHGLRKDQTEFPLELSFSTWKKENQCFYSAIFRDITERKQLIDQLRSQAALIEHATDAICVINMEAQITYWNKSASLLYGWSATEAVGKMAHDLLFKSRPAQASEAFRTLIEKCEWEGDMHQVTRAGKKIFVHSRWILMHDSDGTAKSILVINSDITGKKKLEGQFARAQRLESVCGLAGGIAHD